MHFPCIVFLVGEIINTVRKLYLSKGRAELKFVFFQSLEISGPLSKELCWNASNLGLTLDAW